MTLADLITLFREEADDKATPYLWSDFLLTQYANQGQQEACRRSRLITGPATHIVFAGDQKIALSDNIILIKSVRIASKFAPLERIHRKDIDNIFPGWDTTVNMGDVIAFVPDKETNAVWFNSPFPADDTVTMDVLRGPLYDMAPAVVVGTATTTAAIGPEIASRYQWGLVHWMLHRAFGKQDSETNDPEKSQHALDAFEKEFGPPVSAKEEAWRATQNGYDDYDGSY